MKLEALRLAAVGAEELFRNIFWKTSLLTHRKEKRYFENMASDRVHRSPASLRVVVARRATMATLLWVFLSLCGFRTGATGPLTPRVGTGATFSLPVPHRDDEDSAPPTDFLAGLDGLPEHRDVMADLAAQSRPVSRCLDGSLLEHRHPLDRPPAFRAF